jgi:tRNA (guanosine-2'-O-)-methyltransferase
MAGDKYTTGQLAKLRRTRARSCGGHLIVAPLWVAYEANLGTLLRTCDAVGACMAVPDTPHYRAALRRGDTLTRRPHVHWVTGDRRRWIAEERKRGAEVLAVELADDAISLPLLQSAAAPTIVLLGHERNGVPEDIWPLIDRIVQIPMAGVGASLNVAVAGSLVLYRLAGMS